MDCVARAGDGCQMAGALAQRRRGREIYRIAALVGRPRTVDSVNQNGLGSLEGRGVVRAQEEGVTRGMGWDGIGWEREEKGVCAL
jgi:hypothetical protein